MAMANTEEANVVEVPIAGFYDPSKGRITLTPIDGISCDPEKKYRVALNKRPCRDCTIYQAGCGGMHPFEIESRSPFTGNDLEGADLRYLPLIATADLNVEDIDEAICLQEGAQVSLHIARKSGDAS